MPDERVIERAVQHASIVPPTSQDADGENPLWDEDAKHEVARTAARHVAAHYEAEIARLRGEVEWMSKVLEEQRWH